MGLFSKKDDGKALDKALAAFQAGANLRPARDAPREAVHALMAEARALHGVRALTLAESKAQGGRGSRLLVGVRMDPRGPLTFKQAEDRLRAAVAEVSRQPTPLTFEALDDDVAPTMADGSPNPYVIFVREG